jgi:hypothetical protein
VRHVLVADQKKDVKRDLGVRGIGGKRYDALNVEIYIQVA